MTKFAATLVAAVMTAAGLVVATGTPASAQCAPTQYAGCFKTVTKVTATKRVPKGYRATICVSVAPAAGSAKPMGTVTVSIKKRRSSQVIRRQVEYFGGKTCLVTRKLTKKGRYVVVADYRSRSGSVFYDSSGKTRFRVFPTR